MSVAWNFGTNLVRGLDQVVTGEPYGVIPGAWRGLAPIPGELFESGALDATWRDEGNKELRGYFRFLTRVLRWLPEERPSARELLEDEWLQSD